MKRLPNDQINSKVYWDYIYTTPARSKEYWGRTHRFFTCLDYIKDGDKFIDLGCGVGLPCRLVREKRKSCEIWGVDISSEVIKNNKKDEPSIRWEQGYIGGLSFLPKDYFDVVFCGETIEHLDNPREAFIDAYTILKKGGKFIITTPIENHIQSPEHIWEFAKDDIEKLYTDTGFGKPEFINLPDMEHLMVFFAVGIK